MLDWILSWETVIVAGVVEKDMACETKFEKEWDFHINLKEQEVNKIRIAQNYKKIVETYCLGWITNWFRSLQCSWKSSKGEFDWRLEGVLHISDDVDSNLLKGATKLLLIEFCFNPRC
jgi:hypothetical protein